MMLLCVNNNKWFDWFDQVYQTMVQELELDLLSILLEVYKNKSEQTKKIKQQLHQVNSMKKEEKEKEKSFIASLRSESEVESESEESRRSSNILLKE